MDPGSFFRVFVAVFLAELPDKSMVASIVLVARYRRPLAVWCGATAGFAVHVAAAVLAGRLLRLLPATVVQLVVAGLFAFGAVVLVRSAPPASSSGGDDSAPTRPGRAGPALAASFALIVAAEWGDLTQLATASLAAGSTSPASVAAGALVAESSVAALAVLAGRQIVTRVPLRAVNLAAAGLFAALAVASLARVVPQTVW